MGAWGRRGAVPCRSLRLLQGCKGGAPTGAAGTPGATGGDREGLADIVPTTTDSYTRNEQFHLAQKGVTESEKAGRSLLNGYPIVNYGVAKATELIDAIEKPKLLPIIAAYQEAFPFAELYPLSALKGDGVEGLLTLLGKHLPEGEALYPEDVITDQAERAIVSEYIREKVLRFCRQEVPYSTAVQVEEFDETDRGDGGTSDKPRGLVRINAVIYVERASQKAIVIGKGGSMLKKLGTGLFVTELMGQGVNYVTGDYSRGAAGYWVEKGVIQHPVHEITIAGHLGEMFQQIVAIGADAYTYGSKTVGSVLIEKMKIAGH